MRDGHGLDSATNPSPRRTLAGPEIDVAEDDDERFAAESGGESSGPRSSAAVTELTRFRQVSPAR